MLTETQPERLGLPYTPEVAARTEHFYERVSRSLTRAEFELFAPYLARIEDLKREQLELGTRQRTRDALVKCSVRAATSGV
jgi:hypothetical protein